MSLLVTTDLAIHAEGLARRFGDNEAVRGVDLSVARGEIFGFLGPNGAGKSTTVRMLCTLLGPTGGSATVAGHDVVAAPEEVRVRIGVALQEAALDEKQSGREILDLQGRLYGLRGDVLSSQVQAGIELADLGDAIDDRVGTYSGGMKRRLDLAASLVHGPEVLFLDEPTTGLDPVSRARVWEEVRRLNQERGVTIFLTTQYLEEADELADRVAIIDDGRIIEQGTPEALKRAVGSDVVIAEVSGDRAVLAAAKAVADVPGATEVTKGRMAITISTEDGALLVGPIAVALSRANIDVTSLTVRTPSLDDVFLRATGHRMGIGVDGSTSEVIS
ncbi:MAG: ABC-2 type transport system ATP-binding protein [Candidatus Poriferisodalaceae bacterium]